jgi:hypothetical protein
MKCIKLLGLCNIPLRFFFTKNQKNAYSLFNQSYFFSTKNVHKKIYKEKNTPTEETLESKENNLYLQILFSLEKFNILENQNSKDLLKDLLTKDPNLFSKLNESKISKLLNSSEHFKSKEEILDYIEKIISEDMSDEEYQSEKGIRFIRPPHTPKELQSLLNEAEKIYKENKLILMDNDIEVKKEIKEKFIKKIPKYLTLKHLSYPATNSEIILIGAKRNSNLHSLFISDIVSKHKPDLISLHIHPDIPMFINVEGDYKKDWKLFITKNEAYDFLINPSPKILNDIILTSRKMEKIFSTTFNFAADIKSSSKIIFSEQCPMNISSQKKMFADALLTPMIYSHGTRENNFCPIIISDYPKIKLLEDIASRIKMNDLKKIFKNHLQEIEKNNFLYSHELALPEVFLKNRLQYSAEVLRQACYSGKKIVKVMNYEYVEPFVEEWKNIGEKIKPLNKFYFENNEDIIFIDFIEKLAMLDVLYGGFFQNNFFSLNSCPIMCRDTTMFSTGWDSVFELWTHYYNHYHGLLNKNPINMKRYEEYLLSFNVGSEEFLEKENTEEHMREKLFEKLEEDEE